MSRNRSEARAKARELREAEARRQRRREQLVRFGVLAGVAVGLSGALMPLTDEPTYVPLVGAAALAAWYGGLGPAVLTIVR